MTKAFPDLSSHPNVDEAIKAELIAAGLDVVVLPVALSGVPSSPVVGQIKVPGESHQALWQFIRRRTHWQCQGPGLPPPYAEALHASHGPEMKVEGVADKSPSQCILGFAIGYYEVTGSEGLAALASTIRKVIADATQRELEKTVTDHAINTHVNAIVSEWLFPGECIHTPDWFTLAKSHKLTTMLRRRMWEMRSEGTNPLGMTMADILPGVNPNNIEIHEHDF